MSSTLIDKKIKTYSGKKLTRYLNEERGSSFDDLPEALASIGITVAGATLIPPLAVSIATYLGIALGIDTVASIIEEDMDKRKLGRVLEEIGTTGTLEVTTKFYEWLSGSGNHTGYYAEVTYRAI